MAITISGENNNDRILASDGVIDQISGINIVGLITASHINVGSNIQLGNAGIITATTFAGNLTGNVNSTSPLLLQTGGSERFRITSDNALGIAGANYGSSGQVLTSGGSGSAVTWTTITQGVTSDAQRNTVGGTNAGDSFTGTDATDNTIFGYNAGTSLTSGDKNVIIGAYAAASVTTVGNFVAIGNSAYSSQVSSNGGSVAIGHNALKTYTGSFSNVAIGQGAGQDMGSSGGQNTLVGDNAGYGCKGYNSVIIGFHAGSASNTQGGETIIGMQARYNGNNKAGNTAVGKEAMFGASGGNGSHTTAIGYEALKVLNNGGNQNTALGYQAGDKVNTGTSNVIIGYSAASTGTNDLTNGSNNIIIGKEAAATSATVSNEVTIGDANITRFRIPGIGLDLTSAPPTLANGADNRVVTASSASALNGESTLTYDGTTLSNTNGGANFTKSANNYVLVGSTNASGASLVLDGDSNGDGSGTDYAYLTHNTDGDLDIVVDNPANAGNIKFFTNSSTERLRINSNGSIQITPEGSTSTPYMLIDTSGDSVRFSAQKASGNNEFRFLTQSSGTVAERLRITSDGEVFIGDGLGDNNRSTLLSISGAYQEATGAWAQMGLYSSDSYAQNKGGSIVFGGQDGATPKQYFAGIAGVKENTTSGNYAGVMKFYTRPSGSTPVERLRIHSNGTQSWNNTTFPYNEHFHFYAGISGKAGLSIYHATDTDEPALVIRHGRAGANSNAWTGKYVQFRESDQNERGSITGGSSSVSFNTSSDYRLKENAVAISDGITRLKTLKPYRFNFKIETDKIVDGFFAHEVTAVPEAITGTKDEVDSDDKPVYQGIDQSKLIPLLTAALQEAVAKIEVLETKVAALEGS